MKLSSHTGEPYRLYGAMQSQIVVRCLKDEIEPGFKRFRLNLK